MKKIRYMLLFVAMFILLVGMASATGVSEDVTDTNSITKEAVIQDTHKVSETATIQENKMDESMQTSKSSDNKSDENTTKTLVKNSNTDVKTAPIITNWKELQTAVNNMKKNENLTLILGEGTYINTGTITVYKSNSSLTIDGNGQTINGNKKQLFSVNGSTSLVLKNIIITNGSSYDGGAIINHEKLTIINSTLANNSANNYGGAIRNRYGTLTIINSTLVNNTAKYGGAIDNYEKTIITNSTLANNSAKYGGAINDDGRLTITGSTLANNTATYDGGAITHSLIRNYTIVNSNFTNNHAKRGGAIYSPGCLNLTKNIFTNNTADNKETIDYLSENFGGYFKDNVYKSTSIALKTNKLSIKDNENFFSSEDEIVLNFSIAVEHPHYYDSDILERVDDITIYLNDKEYATTRYENYTLSNLKQGNYSVYYKAYNQKSNTIKFTVHNITNWQDLCDAVNVAKNQTKDINITLQRGLYINTGTINWINPNMTLTIDGNGQWIYGNQLQAFNINGRSSMVLKNITLIGAKSRYGGAIKNEGKLTVMQSTLANNTADYGGAIENLGTLTVNQSTLIGNTAEDGGAIQNYGPLTIIDSTLSYNTASHYGGAIKNYQTLFTVTSSNITNNTAERGGAIFSDGKSNLTSNTFINNTADNNETIDLNGYRSGHAEDNTYKSTDIALWKMKLNIKDDKKTFKLGEDVTLNYNFTIKNPEYYDENIMEKLGNITIYVNNEEYATTDNYKNYTLTPSKPGKYNVYIKLCNQKSNTNTFTVKSPITNWQQLSEAVNNTKDKTEDTTIYLGEGNYKNTGTINWTNPDMTLTIDGCGQTIDGNQQQVFNITDGASLVLKNITITNAKSDIGGAIYNEGTLNITHCTLTNNTATKYGGAIRNGQHTLTITDSTMKNNHAKRGAAIFTSGHTNLTSNTFTNNTADNNETIDLHGYRNAHAENNTYKNTDIALKPIELNIKNNQKTFKPTEEIVLNYSIELEHPRYYDTDILERLDDITVYVNGAEYATTQYENYTLSSLEPGEYTAYIKTCNQVSNNVTFNVIDEKQIKITTWDVEMVRARGVTFSAIIDYKNTTINQGQVYFEIDGNPLVDETGSILYAPVKDNHADLPYEMPSDISLGNHTITALYLYDDRILATDDKTLTIIEDIPEGSGDDDKNPSKNGKQETYNKDTRPQKTIAKYTKAIQSSIPTSHKIITDNNIITVADTITLGKLNEIFGQTFTNGHLLLYIDGELVYNGTVGDDIATVLLEIIEKFLGKHEIKVEFTDADGKTNTYNKTIIIE